MRVPGTDHPIVITPSPSPVVIRVGDHQIGKSRRSLVLRESTYPPVRYIPRDDLDMTRLTRTATRTRCPYKGDASYFSITAGGETLVDAAWSYETPYPVAAEIAGHIAFFPDRITVEPQ